MHISMVGQELPVLQVYHTGAMGWSRTSIGDGTKAQ